MRPRARWRRVPERLASVRNGRGSRHLTDRELLRAAVDADGAAGTARDAHLAVCRRCALRLGTLREDLDRLAAAAAAAFDDALPAWRLARPRSRILDRIRRAADRPGSARILRFPAPAARAAPGANPVRRRLALAAAAGLLVVLGVGQAVDGGRRTAANPPPAAAAAPNRPAVEPPGGPPRTAADEQFMRELEEALHSPRVGPLVALDEMTPRVRAAAIDVR